MQATGKLSAVPEREQDAQRQRGKPRDQCDAIELIEPLQRREELEDLPEAAGLELAELQQVERRGDERERHQGEAKNAERDVEHKPGVAGSHGFRAGREPAQNGESHKARGEGTREERDGRTP